MSLDILRHHPAGNVSSDIAMAGDYVWFAIKPEPRLPAATRSSYRVPAPSRLACSFEQIVWSPLLRIIAHVFRLRGVGGGALGRGSWPIIRSLRRRSAAVLAAAS